MPQSPRFDGVQTTDSDGIPVLKVRGDLDMLSAGSLYEIVEDLVDHHCHRLVFDLDELAFMDSSGIAVLVFAANSIEMVELRNVSVAHQADHRDDGTFQCPESRLRINVSTRLPNNETFNVLATLGNTPSLVYSYGDLAGATRTA